MLFEDFSEEIWTLKPLKKDPPNKEHIVLPHMKTSEGHFTLFDFKFV